MLQNLASAAVVIGSLRVNFLSMILSMSFQELKEIKDYYRKGRNIRIYHENGIEKIHHEDHRLALQDMINFGKLNLVIK